MKILNMFLLGMCISAGSVSAQQLPLEHPLKVSGPDNADDFTRNSNEIPNFLDQNSGWVIRSKEDGPNGKVSEVYENEHIGLVVYLWARSENNIRQELYMRYGSKSVGRAAIKVDGNWYVAKGPFYDYGVRYSENDFRVKQFLDKDKNARTKTILDTVDGLKELISPN